MATASPDPRILLASPGSIWRSGGPALLTFTFATDGNDAVGNRLADAAWAPFSAAQQASARLALDAWAATSGLAFLEVPDLAGGGGALGSIDLRFRLEALGTGVLGRATGGGGGEPDGDIALSLGLFRADGLAPSATRIGFTTLLHEIGHGIGLVHPGEGEAAPALGEDSRDITLLSAQSGRLPLPSAPRPLDQQAAQVLYGTAAEEQALGLQWRWDPTLGAIGGPTDGAVRGEGTAGNDHLFGTGLGDLLEGKAGNDLLEGGGGNDTLAGGAGDDTLVGGAGIDTLRSGFARAEIRLDLRAGTLAAPDGTDRFTGIEVFEFADSRLVLDAEAPAAQLLRLYRLAFDRLPDEAVLAHWTLAMEGGVTAAAVASAFLVSNEFVARFGRLDDAGFATLVGAHAAAPGLAFDIVDTLAAGGTRATALAEAADGWAVRRATAADLAAGVWDLHGIAGEIAVLTHLALGRSPDAGSWTRWTVDRAEGMSASAVAEGLLHGAEFLARHGTPDAAALAPLLLHELLGRAPTAAEAAPWLRQVANGLDAADLLLAIADTEAAQHRWAPVVVDGHLLA